MGVSFPSRLVGETAPSQIQAAHTKAYPVRPPEPVVPKTYQAKLNAALASRTTLHAEVLWALPVERSFSARHKCEFKTYTAIFPWAILSPETAQQEKDGEGEALQSFTCPGCGFTGLTGVSREAPVGTVCPGPQWHIACNPQGSADEAPRWRRFLAHLHTAIRISVH